MTVKRDNEAVLAIRLTQIPFPPTKKGKWKGDKTAVEQSKTRTRNPALPLLDEQLEQMTLPF